MQTQHVSHFGKKRNTLNFKTQHPDLLKTQQWYMLQYFMYFIRLSYPPNLTPAVVRIRLT